MIRLLSRAALNRATLARQGLLTRRTMPVVRAVTDFAGLNAQSGDIPYVSLHARLAGFEPAELVRALRRRAVVRATFFRGTIHLLAAADYLSWRALLQPVLDRIVRGDVGRELREVNLDAVLAEAREALVQRPLTRADLGRALVAYEPEHGRPGSATAFAARMMLPLVQVPPAGEWGWHGNPAYQLGESWLGQRPVSSDEDRHALVRRYLAAFGPATIKDLQYWCGLTRMRAVVEAIRPELQVFRDEAGRELYDVDGAPLPDPDAVAPPRLLPAWDNVLFAHADRGRMLPSDGPLAKGPGDRATFLVDGVVAGTWALQRESERIRLVLTPSAEVHRAGGAALIEEAERTAAFLAPEAVAHEVAVAP